LGIENNQMMKDLGIECIVIKEKKIYIFESHHYALYPWALVKRELAKTPLILLSFDYHTDTHDPFLYHNYYNPSKASIDSVDYFKDDSIKITIEKLHHDEHIKTAIQCGILKNAFIISQSGRETPLSNEEKYRIDNLWTDESIRKSRLGENTITPKDKRTYPESDVYITDFESNNDENILNDDFLKCHFETFSRMNSMITAEGNISSKYILDIDLDYFTQPSAVKPEKIQLFSMLVRNSEVITIAKESVCVDMCSNGKANSEDLLDKMLSLIDNIL